jgi:hypothetical protein
MHKTVFRRRFAGSLPVLVALLPVAGLFGCDGEGEGPGREVTAVRLGSHGVLSTHTWTISEAEFQQMVAVRTAQSQVPASRSAPPRPGHSFGPGVLAQAVESDCNSADSTWVFSDINMDGQMICLQYAPDDGPPMGTNLPYRTPWNVRSFWTGNGAAMFCDRRFGNSCEWFSNLGLPFGERFCSWTPHNDFTGSDHPQNPIWVQAQPLGEGCEPN